MTPICAGRCSSLARPTLGARPLHAAVGSAADTSAAVNAQCHDIASKCRKGGVRCYSTAARDFWRNGASVTLGERTQSARSSNAAFLGGSRQCLKGLDPDLLPAQRQQPDALIGVGGGSRLAPSMPSARSRTRPDPTCRGLLQDRQGVDAGQHTVPWVVPALDVGRGGRIVARPAQVRPLDEGQDRQPGIDARLVPEHLRGMRFGLLLPR